MILQKIGAFEIFGPCMGQVRLAEVKPIGTSITDYQIYIEGKLRYYGMVFTWEEAMDRVKHWTGITKTGPMYVSDLRVKREFVEPPIKARVSRKEKLWELF